mmetsp:Transcript_35762/g.41373  ORF Transcript_35762/g.41373 Transcript_35762/m.41373 type:complete len:142 (+) Transcript_35762:411-836(+)
MDSGDLHVVDRATNEVKFTQEKAHEYQMWFTMLDSSDDNIVYTAADDTRFKGWDVRAPGAPIFSCQHDYGVCCIKPWAYSDQTLLTGGYDSALKFWDKRKVMRDPAATGKDLLFTKLIGKSVWDVKFSEESKSNRRVMGLS